MRMRMVSTAQINEQRLTGVFWRAKRGHGGNGHRLDGPYSDFTACGIFSPCLCFLSAGVRGAAWDFFSSFQKGCHFFVSFFVFLSRDVRDLWSSYLRTRYSSSTSCLDLLFFHTHFSHPLGLSAGRAQPWKKTPQPLPLPLMTLNWHGFSFFGTTPQSASSLGLKTPFLLPPPKRMKWEGEEK